MRREQVRDKLLQHLTYSGVDEDKAHEIYHEDAILEFPQSGQRLRGETIHFADSFPAPDWRRPWAEEGAAWDRQDDLPSRVPDRS